jgi:hypothetical protein
MWSAVNVHMYKMPAPSSWLFYPGQVKCKYLGVGRGEVFDQMFCKMGWLLLRTFALSFSNFRHNEDCFTTNTTFKNVVIMHRPAMRMWRTRTRYGSASAKTLWAAFSHTASSRVSSWHRSERQKESNLEWVSPCRQSDMSEQILWLQSHLSTMKANWSFPLKIRTA